MQLLNALVKSKESPSGRFFYISKADYDARKTILTVYNYHGEPYGMKVKRENILSTNPA